MTNSGRKKRKQTDKSRYRHQSTGDYCTCAAYVAEIMCMRNAQNKNVGSLPFKFWTTKEWNWTFKRQMIAANKFLATYPESALLRAVNSPEMKNTFSLNSKRVEPIIIKYSKIIEKELKKQKLALADKKLAVVTARPTGRKKAYGKKSNLNKLRGLKLDGEEEKEVE